MLGTRLRLARLLPNGRMLGVALDHGCFAGASFGAHNPVQAYSTISEARFDAVLLSPGMAAPALEAHARRGRARSLVLRSDGSMPHQGLTSSLLVSVTGALRLGAEAMVIMAPFAEGANLELVARIATLAEEAGAAGLPLVVECFPAPGATLADTVRLCVEAGAHLIKAPIPEDLSDLDRAVAAVPVPIVMAGGSAVPADEFVPLVRSLVKHGAAGMVVGRNVWAHPEPPAMVESLYEAVHGVSV